MSSLRFRKSTALDFRKSPKQVQRPFKMVIYKRLYIYRYLIYEQLHPNMLHLSAPYALRESSANNMQPKQMIFTQRLSPNTKTSHKRRIKPRPATTTPNWPVIGANLLPEAECLAFFLTIAPEAPSLDSFTFLPSSAWLLFSSVLRVCSHHSASVISTSILHLSYWIFVSEGSGIAGNVKVEV